MHLYGTYSCLPASLWITTQFKHRLDDVQGHDNNGAPPVYFSNSHWLLLLLDWLAFYMLFSIKGQHKKEKFFFFSWCCCTRAMRNKTMALQTSTQSNTNQQHLSAVLNEWNCNRCDRISILWTIFRCYSYALYVRAWQWLSIYVSLVCQNFLILWYFVIYTIINLFA